MSHAMWTGGSNQVKKNGFVLMETIVVISVLCLVLVMLYGAYSNILTNVESKSLYDNTEYIFKTALVRNYLEKIGNVTTYDDFGITVCQNSDSSSSHKCYTSSCSTERCQLFKLLKVEGVYITPWNLSSLNSSLPSSKLDATTRKYLKSIDAPDAGIGAKRIAIMYLQENNETTSYIYEYASLKTNIGG